MFPNFMNNVRDHFDHVAHDVAQTAERFRSPSTTGNNDNNTNTNTNYNNWASRFFGGFDPSHQQQQHEQQQQQQSNNQRAPPASTRALRQLPTIRVAPEDLIDPANRECCICLEENALDDHVIRMPCAHIFHSDCIKDWLTRSCTCPVCRFELPTDDPQYEAGRIERMKARKPRYALHELKRMKVSQLIALNRNRPVPPGMEKKDLIQYLIDEERIDIIPAPEPVEYSLTTLKDMKIRQLKSAMEDAGVFYRQEDVVEKEDMISIFKNSGRLILLPSDSTVSSTSTSSSRNSNDGVAENTTSNSQTFPDSTFVDQDNVVEDDTKPSAKDDTSMEDTTISSGRESLTGYPGHLPKVETVTEDSDDENEVELETPASTAEVLFTQQEEEFTVNQPQKRTKSRHESSSSSLSSSPPPPVASNIGGNTSSSTRASDTDDSINNPPEAASNQSPPRVSVAATAAATAAAAQSTTSDLDDAMDIDFVGSPTRETDTFQHYTIAQLQELARDAGVDISSCFERAEMIALLRRAGLSPNSNPENLSSVLFSSWSVSQLRAVASQASIDLSQCDTREAMIEKILHEANNERPHLRDYLRSMSPLTEKSLSDLRAIARELQVNISDCLEKDEIILRLITRGTSMGVC